MGSLTFCLVVSTNINYKQEGTFFAEGLLQVISVKKYLCFLNTYIVVSAAVAEISGCARVL